MESEFELLTNSKTHSWHEYLGFTPYIQVINRGVNVCSTVCKNLCSDLISRRGSIHFVFFFVFLGGPTSTTKVTARSWTRETDICIRDPFYLQRGRGFITLSLQGPKYILELHRYLSRLLSNTWFDSLYSINQYIRRWPPRNSILAFPFPRVVPAPTQSLRPAPLVLLLPPSI